jgi:hypothetical protein
MGNGEWANGKRQWANGNGIIHFYFLNKRKS